MNSSDVEAAGQAGLYPTWRCRWPSRHRAAARTPQGQLDTGRLGGGCRQLAPALLGVGWLTVPVTSRNLASPKYDLVCAMTLAAIDATMKRFFSQNNGTEFGGFHG